MPIVIKGAKLTDELTTSIKEIASSVRELFSRKFLSSVRELEKGVEIPCGYRKFFAALQEKYPSAELVAPDNTVLRHVFTERNKSIFDKFKEQNGDYLRSDKNALLIVTSAPGGLMDPEKVAAFLTKTFSKVTPAQGHKFKITAKYQVLDAIRKKVDADDFTDGSGASIKGRCAMMPIRYVEGRSPQRGTRVAVVVPVASVEELFAALSADELFDRVPTIKFVNLEERHRRIQERRERLGSAGDSPAVAKPAQKRSTETAGRAKDKANQSKSRSQSKDQDGKKSFRRRRYPGGEKLPSFLKVMNVPNGVTFDDIKGSLNEKEHADILKAIAESRIRRPRLQDPSVISFFCTTENGKILMEAFGNMDIDGSKLAVVLEEAR